MELCSEGHGEVCYETRFCPACEKIEELTEKINELKKNNAKLEKDNEDMQAQLDSE